MTILLDMISAKNQLITLSQKVILICTMLPSGFILAQAPADSGRAATPLADETGITASDPPPRRAPEVEQIRLELLQEAVQADELRWLEADGEKFMALWQRNKTGNPFGAVLILHGEGQTASWPHTVSAIRNNLSQHGWSTLAVSLPPLAKAEIPARNAVATGAGSAPSIGDENNAPTAITAGKRSPEQISDARLSAAIEFLNQLGQYNIVMVGHASGAIRATRFINSISGNQASDAAPSALAIMERPIRALIMVEARNRMDHGGERLVSFLNDTTLPVLDIYYGDHYLDVLEVRQRKKMIINKGITRYYQVQVLRPSKSDEMSENRLTRRIRGFLNRHAKGVEIERPL